MKCYVTNKNYDGPYKLGRLPEFIIIIIDLRINDHDIRTTAYLRSTTSGNFKPITRTAGPNKFVIVKQSLTIGHLLRILEIEQCNTTFTWLLLVTLR